MGARLTSEFLGISLGRFLHYGRSCGGNVRRATLPFDVQEIHAARLKLSNLLCARISLSTSICLPFTSLIKDIIKPIAPQLREEDTLICDI